MNNYENNNMEQHISQEDRNRRTYLINGEWVHVPNCKDDTPWAEADESDNNPKGSR